MFQRRRQAPPPVQLIIKKSNIVAELVPIQMYIIVFVILFAAADSDFLEQQSGHNI